MRSEYDFKGGKRGAVLRPTQPKERITIRLDADVVEWFRNAAHKAGGASYQTMINDALRRYLVAEQTEPFEATIRRVLREELSELEVTPSNLDAGQRKSVFAVTDAKERSD